MSHNYVKFVTWLFQVRHYLFKKWVVDTITEQNNNHDSVKMAGKSKIRKATAH
ncbi:hypothetical protein [Paenibacillus foliorum]|uniref:hypothetical protein n=1 Tax=Paenibacillus foliorum TaxID=2654974 RepID=UPI001C11A91C|nr:hypothetical protein [Paenibacillus foliorum]